MSWRSPQRTASCTKADAATRLKQAQKFYEVAELVQTEAGVVESATSVSASLAVLAGIAACDATCCAALGRRSRSQDHKAAVTLLRQVEPGSDEAAARLDRLLDLKDTAHDGVIYVSGKDLRSCVPTSGVRAGSTRERRGIRSCTSVFVDIERRMSHNTLARKRIRGHRWTW